MRPVLKWAFIIGGVIAVLGLGFGLGFGLKVRFLTLDFSRKSIINLNSVKYKEIQNQTLISYCCSF